MIGFASHQAAEKERRRCDSGNFVKYRLSVGGKPCEMY